VENSYFRNYVGVSVATAYAPSTTQAAIKKAIVRNSQFDRLSTPANGQYASAAISMNYGMATGDTVKRDPVIVYDFNRKTGDTFRVFYSSEIPQSAVPCGETRPDISGLVCLGDGATQETRR
jgi:hypothetical protein